MICLHCGKETPDGLRCAECGGLMGSGGVLISPSVSPDFLRRRVPAPCIVPRGGVEGMKAGSKLQVAQMPVHNSKSEVLSSSGSLSDKSVVLNELPPSITYGEVSAPEAVAAPAAPVVTMNTAAQSMYPSMPDQVANPTDTKQRVSSAYSSSSKEVDLSLLPPPASRLPAIGRFVSYFLPVLLIQAAVTHFLPSFYVIPWLGALVIGALLLSVLRVTPFPDEDPDDMAMFVILTLLFGPIAGLTIFAVIGALRQSINPALVGCYIVAICCLGVNALTLHSGNIGHVILYTMPFTPFTAKTQIGWPVIRVLMLDWMSLITLVGWYMSTSFRKLDE